MDKGLWIMDNEYWIMKRRKKEEKNEINWQQIFGNGKGMIDKGKSSQWFALVQMVQNTLEKATMVHSSLKWSHIDMD